MRYLIFGLLTCLSSAAFAQQNLPKINQTDKKGRPDGLWHLYRGLTFEPLEQPSQEGFVLEVMYKKGKVASQVAVKDMQDNLYMRGNFKSLLPDIKHGHCSWYYPNGVVRQTSTFKNNLPQGKGTEFYDDGTVRIAYNQTKKGLNGTVLFYDPMGIVVAQGKYKNNQKIGTWSYFHDNGSPKANLHYKKNEQLAPHWTYFAADGKAYTLPSLAQLQQRFESQKQNGDYIGMETTCNHALTLIEVAHSINSQVYIDVLTQYAQLLNDIGQDDRAYWIENKANYIRNNIYAYLRIEIETAADLFKDGNYSEALAILEKNFDSIKLRLLGSDNEFFMDILFIMARCYDELNKVEKANACRSMIDQLKNH